LFRAALPLARVVVNFYFTRYGTDAKIPARGAVEFMSL